MPIGLFFQNYAEFELTPEDLRKIESVYSKITVQEARLSEEHMSLIDRQAIGEATYALVSWVRDEWLASSARCLRVPATTSCSAMRASARNRRADSSGYGNRGRNRACPKDP